MTDDEIREKLSEPCSSYHRRTLQAELDRRGQSASKQREPDSLPEPEPYIRDSLSELMEPAIERLHHAVSGLDSEAAQQILCSLGQAAAAHITLVLFQRYQAQNDIQRMRWLIRIIEANARISLIQAFKRPFGATLDTKELGQNLQNLGGEIVDIT